ncbi:MAG: DUF748 domain-containing protein [Gammaproteobacteria bacterium]|nr:MAG: DUF748 domain-containing protein [Gammaproteobacteria bacterium]
MPTSFLHALYRSIILRVLFVVLILLSILCLCYYFWALPWVNRAVSENYFEQTGHKLQHDKINLQLFKCNLSIGHLKDSANLWQADSVNLNVGCLQSFHERGIVINDITIKQLRLNATQNENALWNFDDVIKHQQILAKEAAQKKKTDENLSVIIKKLTLVNSTLHTNLVALNSIPMDASPLNLSISNINFAGKDASNFSLNADLNKTAKIAIAGKLNLLSLSGEVDINANNIPFVWFNKLLEPYVTLEVLSGAFEFHKHINLVAGTPQKVVGNGKLSDLKLRPMNMEQDAVKWKSLEWENAEISLTEKSIHIPAVTLNELDGQFIVDKNRTTNVQAMIVTAAPPPATSTAAPTESKPWQFAIDRFAVNNAAVGFYDQSLTPAFTAIVQNFTGDIVNISSDENSLATIKLAGNVDGYAPVTLQGQANVFRKVPKLDALLSFKQMDMGALSPYSAEYAGWKIKKGLLSADLNYHYEDGKILGKNHVVIDHLEFGEKVRGTRVVDIPLRLGLALLTDENHIAVLDTVISGTPSDPEFNIKDVITRALSNTLKKIITSPFKFLSNLLNTSEDLGKIQFTPGESQLTDEAKNKAQLLTEALKKRPKMRLSVQGTFDPNTDLLALKEEQVKSALQKAGVAPESLKDHNETWVAAVNTRYQIQGLVSPTNLQLTADEKYQALIAAEAVDPERLNRLAHERAQAIKQYFILQLGVSSETILLNSDPSCGKSGQCSAEAIFTLEV